MKDMFCKSSVLSLFLIINCKFLAIFSLDNGLALTPPMGWMSWERFRCITDCELFPEDCLREELIQTIADRMVDDGYLAAGYEYLIIDDCWLATERDSDDRLQPNAERFPSGIKALADYIHGKGLKFGIYEDYGNLTCGGYPGIAGHLELDAQTFAEWDVDYIKLDGCYSDDVAMEAGYAEFGRYLNATGRPIVFSCSYPAYEDLDTNYTAAIQTCNLWRNYNDIQDSWESLVDIVNWYSEYQGYLNRFSGPGHWNDPDMLIIGNYGLSYDESVSQMALWSVLTAPLLMSVDLRNIRSEFKEILLNPDAIRINQDPLGIPAYQYLNIQNVKFWLKPINPIVDNKRSYALAIVNFRDDGAPSKVIFQLNDLRIDGTNGYTMKNIFQPSDVVEVSIYQNITVSVNPSGAVLLEFNPLESV